MPDPRPLEVMPFGLGDPLHGLSDRRQTLYLRRYLEDLGAATVVAEPYYFDRDYLAEFAAFYCVSSAGYANVCRRLHFFGAAFDRLVLEQAIGNGDDATRLLRDNYLGFIVLRPIPASPIGRTVLRWYPDDQAATTPRVVSPSRDYHCHLAGVRLTVSGLAWQQQDSAVGTCATISLWSMLHSSALDGLHALPTTAAVTRAAHRTASLGQRVFPSTGLDVWQLCEAIKEHGLSPVVVAGDLPRPGAQPGFSRERFNASCAALIRSGFPPLVLGSLGGAGHAVCAVGFRSAVPPQAVSASVAHHDQDIPFVYIHDDNLGPSVRFGVHTDSVSAAAHGMLGVVYLKPEAPALKHATQTPDPTTDYPEFVPTHLVAAVPDDLRTSPDRLHVAGLDAAVQLSQLLSAVAQQQGLDLPGLTLSSRFSRLRDYLGRDLGELLGGNPAALAKARLALVERVPPMSLHIGVVRIGSDASPLLDILFDTSDSDLNHPVFAHVVFAPGVGSLVAALADAGPPLGIQVDAT